MDTSKLDAECVSLCLAMNKLFGIHTEESCSGHGRETFRVWFRADSLEALTLVAFWCDSRFNGGIRWGLHVMSKAPSPGVIFVVESESIGQRAYTEADKIAELISQEAEKDTSVLIEKSYVAWLKREIGEDFSQADEKAVEGR